MEGQSQSTAPPERENFARPRQQRGATPAGREANQPAVDARSLGARPEGARGPLLIRKHNSDSPLLGARPEGARGPLLIRKVNRDFSPLDTSPEGARGPLLRARTQEREEPTVRFSNERAQRPLSIRKVNRDGPLRDKDVTDSQLDSSKGRNMVQRHPNKDVNNFQPDSSREENSLRRLSSREQSARYTDARGAGPASQAHQSRFPNDQSSFQRKGEGRPLQPRRSRAGRPRSDRNRDDVEPRRRNRDAKRGYGENNRRERQEEPMTGEERQYLKEKSEQESPKDITFEPMEFSRETFSGMGSVTASDEWGMSELLGEKLLLARKYLDGEFIQWDSKEQKADVMAVAKKLRAVSAGEKPRNQAKTASPTSGDGDEQAQALMQKLFAGEYAEFKRLGVNDVLGHVERNVHRNETFYPDDEKSLLAKVKSIMLAKRAPIGARNQVQV